ncbi:MAG: decarboxylating 6-phosphogluconate dehydrogenase [Candidatus Aenigmarchaeota archaeon]|nr:decarboxylating 6-phosphogluconate dehydrogenase [Candidatus Aenigmarchaeota archaeon]
MKVGLVGLGRMGTDIAKRLVNGGHEVFVWGRSDKVFKNAEEVGARGTTDMQEFFNQLPSPRIIWLMVTSDAVDEVLQKTMPYLSKGDIVVDGGNSFFKDSIRRASELKDKGINFLDVGTSGGIEGEEIGYCIMVGGEKEIFHKIEPILQKIATKDGYGYVGKSGAGHFAKMVHNGIEYGMMESIGEGAAMLKNSQFDFDLREVFRIYSAKSIIDSRLVSWTLNELRENPDLSGISSIIGSGGSGEKIVGEGHWTVQTAKEMGIDVPAIEAAVRVRDSSDKDSESSPSGFRNKVVAAMRWQFGQHPVKKDKPKENE